MNWCNSNHQLLSHICGTQIPMFIFYTHIYKHMPLFMLIFDLRFLGKKMLKFNVGY